MDNVWIAVGIIFAVGFTLVMCVTFAGSWYAIVQMRKVQAAADKTAELISNLVGDGSLNRAAKATSMLVDQMPELISVARDFNRTMAVFTKAMFVSDKGSEAARQGEDDGFYPYSEELAEQVEQAVAARRDRLELTDEQLKVMRTDHPKQPYPRRQKPGGQELG